MMKEFGDSSGIAKFDPHFYVVNSLHIEKVL